MSRKKFAAIMVMVVASTTLAFFAGKEHTRLTAETPPPSHVEKEEIPTTLEDIADEFIPADENKIPLQINSDEEKRVVNQILPNEL